MWASHICLFVFTHKEKKTTVCAMKVTYYYSLVVLRGQMLADAPI